MAIPGAFIYALADPVTLACRYVGKSSRLVARYKTHLYEARKGCGSHKLAWIRSLRGRCPLLLVLEYVGADADWEERERLWIAELRRRGCDLTNCTDGGEGVPLGMKHSEEAKRRISESLVGNTRGVGRTATPETRARMSASRMGRRLPPSKMRGRQQPAALVARRAAATRARGTISESMKRVWSERRAARESAHVDHT